MRSAGDRIGRDPIAGRAPGMRPPGDGAGSARSIRRRIGGKVADPVPFWGRQDPKMRRRRVSWDASGVRNRGPGSRNFM